MLYIIIAAVVIGLFILAYKIAREFEAIAEEKGFYGRTYFWWCFAFGIVGWAMVIALPDRKANKDK